MSKSYLSVIIFAFFTLTACEGTKNNILDYVDPMIGTDGIGHTFPGATTPFGMIQLSPSDDTPEWNWCSGYHYSDDVLKGFAHNHFSGTGLTGMGDILIMPTFGEIKTNPGTKENPDSGYRSRFSHDNEKASPGYYSVLLDDYDINVELTATPRVGLHRYIFNKTGKQNIILDVTHGVRGNTLNADVEIISDTEIIGHKYTHDASCGKRDVYFYAKFSKPFNKAGVTIDDEIILSEKKAESKTAKAFISYDGESADTVCIAVALSYVDYEGAKLNYKTEVKGKTFDQLHTDARKMWNEKVSKIVIEGATEEEKTIFYTGMYHSFIAPNIISDVNGNYIVEGKKYNSPNLTQYSNFSTWDTYRATHPLWTIIDQKANKEFIDVLQSRFTKTKTGLALWEALGFDNYCMIGYPGISVMVEAALKQPNDYDLEKIYKYVRETAFRDGGSSPNYGSDNGVRYYINYGYVPGEVGCSVSKTTEYNYYDFSIAQLAKTLDKKNDEELFRKRSIGYRNHFNEEKKYLWPRLSSGEWVEMDTTGWDDLVHNYISGNIWAYSAYTPHDMLGAIELFGGKEKYYKWLDAMISTPLNMKGEQHVDIAGFIGKYSHGDEPGHQIPYLYNFAAKPWKTQELVRRVMTEMHSHNPDGLVNNEDCGQMSSWYIFSALGFYPVAPSDLNYYFGSPLFPKSTINLENGKTFTVITNNNSSKNKYIRSVSLNGKDIDRIYIKHKEIMDGGELIFEMGPKPNKKWATSKNALPTYYKEMLKLETKPLACYTPKITDSNYRFASKKLVELKCNTQDARIYYTLNGNTPNQNSVKYDNPFYINESIELKAISYKEGLKPSKILSKKFYESVFTNLDKGYPKISFENEPKKYGAVDGSQLIDMIFASETFSDRKWTGINEKDLIINIDLGQKIGVTSLELSSLTSTQKWRFPPKSISVLVKEDGEFKKVAKRTYNEISVHTKKINYHKIKFPLKKSQYVKIVIENHGKLPDWHEGAGKLPWIFVDEININ